MASPLLGLFRTMSKTVFMTKFKTPTSDLLHLIRSLYLLQEFSGFRLPKVSSPNIARLLLHGGMDSVFLLLIKLILKTQIKNNGFCKLTGPLDFTTTEHKYSSQVAVWGFQGSPYRLAQPGWGSWCQLLLQRWSEDSSCRPHTTHLSGSSDQAAPLTSSSHSWPGRSFGPVIAWHFIAWHDFKNMCWTNWNLDLSSKQSHNSKPHIPGNEQGGSLNGSYMYSHMLTQLIAELVT